MLWSEIYLSIQLCLEIFLIRVVWTYATFGNNFGINYKLEKIFEGELLILFDHYFSFK